jgi:hypothetical protein
LKPVTLLSIPPNNRKPGFIFKTIKEYQYDK